MFFASVQNRTDAGHAVPPQSFMATIPSAAFAAVLTVLFPVVGGTQALPETRDSSTPVFHLQVLGDANSGFSTRIDGYFELRGRLERTLPPVTLTNDVRQIRHCTFIGESYSRSAPRSSAGRVFYPHDRYGVQALTRPDHGCCALIRFQACRVSDFFNEARHREAFGIPNAVCEPDLGQRPTDQSACRREVSLERLAGAPADSDISDLENIEERTVLN